MAEQKTRNRGDEARERPPWRVEGEREDGNAQDVTPKRRGRFPRPPFSRRLYGFLIGLLILNVILGQLIPSSEDRRMDVPYTFFRDQVQAGNVKEVNSRNDVIQGEFRKPVKFKDEGPE